MKLNAYQSQAIAYVRRHGGELRRLPGGFWVTPDCKLRSATSPAGRIPEHGEISFGTTTVRSLEAKGVLQRLHVFAEEWRDTRGLA